MRQCWWVELFKHYNYDILYHPRKDNMVANALSRRGASIATIMVQEWLLLEQLSGLSISMSKQRPIVFYSYMKVQSKLVEWIRV